MNANTSSGSRYPRETIKEQVPLGIFDSPPSSCPTVIKDRGYYSDRIHFGISLVMLILLSGFLILFYSSAIYNTTLLDLTAQGKNKLITGAGKANTSDTATGPISTEITIFNPYATIEASKTTLTALLYTVISPIVFFSIGYLLCIYIRKKNIPGAILLFMVALLFDFVIAYEIVSQIYLKKYTLELVDEPWHFEMILSQVDFYFILLFSFISYILWEQLLNQVLETYLRIRLNKYNQYT